MEDNKSQELQSEEEWLKEQPQMPLELASEVSETETAVLEDAEPVMEEETEAEETEAGETEAEETTALEDESAEVLEEEKGTEEVVEQSTFEEESTKEDIIEQEIVEEPAVAENIAEGNTPSAAPRGLVVQTWQLAIAAVIVVAMIAGGVVLGVLLGNREDANDFNGSPVDYDWVLPQGSNPGANQIVVPGYGDLLFTAGQKQIEIILPNPKNNPCYFRYTLLLDDTGEILYQSPLIAPGKAVLEIELSRALTKGDYHLTIVIDSIAIADGRTPMNGAEHHVLLQVR